MVGRGLNTKKVAKRAEFERKKLKKKLCGGVRIRASVRLFVHIAGGGRIPTLVAI
jgi:hypothetical protein